MYALFNFMGNFVHKIVLFTLYATSVILIVLIVMVFYVYKNQSKLVDLLLKQLNEYEVVVINYNNIQFDTFKNFPYATFSFTDFIVTLPVKESSDTLISTKKIDLKINVARLFLGDFEINSFDAENGKVNLKAYLLQKNNVGYSTNNPTSYFQNEFSITRFTLSNFKILLPDTLNQQNTLLDVDRLSLNLRAKNEITANLDCQLKETKIGDKLNLTSLTQIRASARYDGKIILLRNVKISSNGIRAEFQGLYRLDNSMLSLNFKLNRTNLSDLIKIAHIKGFPSGITGKTSIAGKLEYSISEKEINTLLLGYNAQNVSLMVKGKKMEFEELVGQSKFTNNLQRHTGKVSKAKIRYDNMEASLSGRAYGTKQIIILAEGFLRLAKNGSPFTNALAGVGGDGTVKVLLEVKKDQNSNNKDVNLTIHDVATDFNFSIDSLPKFKNLSKISGKVDIHDEATLKATAYLDSSKIDFTIYQKYIVNCLNNLSNFTPSIYLKADYLNLDSLIHSISAINKVDTNKVRATIETSINSKKLVYANYTFDNVTGVMKILGDSIYVKGLQASGFKGKIEGNIMVVGSQYSIDASMDGIDITELFKHFNSWNQKYITYKNIEGRLSGHCNFDFELDSASNILWSMAKMNSDITIKDGKLRGMNNIKKLSRWLRLDQVKSIDFTTIHNNIVISNGCVYIPSMDMNSNVLGLNVSGKHFLTNTYEYHARINFSDVLAHRFLSGSADFSQPKTSSGAINLYLTLKGNGSNYEVFLDKKSSFEDIRNTINSEGQSLKEIISSEVKQTFGDTLNKQSIIHHQPTPQKFSIEWDEYDTTKLK
jgi:hypothetical protein